MLQIPNIVKNYRILIPPTLASAITGPLATMVFKMENIPMGAGMGTSGLVGQFGTITAMAESAELEALSFDSASPLYSAGGLELAHRPAHAKMGLD